MLNSFDSLNMWQTNIIIWSLMFKSKNKQTDHRPQTTAQTLEEELADPSRVQSYHKPCVPALMGLTAGCPLSSWAA